MSGFFTRTVFFLIALALPLAVALGFMLPEKSKPVNVGTTGTIADVGLYIAHAKGYFREEGLDVNLAQQVGGSRMLDALAAGKIDVGGAIASPSLYNVATNGAFKIVADKGSLAPMQNHYTLLVRSDLVKSGRFKTIADLKGLNIAVPSIPDNVASARLNTLLEAGGVSWNDVTVFNGGLPMHPLAFERREIDAALTTEPISGHIVSRGIAVRVNQADLIYQTQQVGTLLYATAFIEQRREDGERFMRAYLRGVRDFHESLVNGRLVGNKAEEVLRIITASTVVKDPAVFRALMVPANNPNGEVNLKSLAHDLDFFKQQNWVHDPGIEVAQFVDGSFATAATRELGWHGFSATVTQVLKSLRNLMPG